MQVEAIRERFFSKVQKSEGCWLYTGAHDAFGYGKVGYRQPGVKARVYLAHRVSWALAHGQVPDDLCVLHRCDNPPCVNPAHLFLGTRTDNYRDMMVKGRATMPVGRAHQQRAKTHCRSGHEYSQENTQIRHGTRVCKRCRHEGSSRAAALRKIERHRLRTASSYILENADELRGISDQLGAPAATTPEGGE